jgi:hypothetical protein
VGGPAALPLALWRGGGGGAYTTDEVELLETRPGEGLGRRENELSAALLRGQGSRISPDRRKVASTARHCREDNQRVTMAAEIRFGTREERL